MRNKAHTRTLRTLLEHARFEVLPTAKVEAAVIQHLPAGRTVTVTASPSKGLGASLALTERLVAHGYDVVPHLAARMVAGRTELVEIVDRLVSLGVTSVFVPAGDADPPAGPFPGSLDLLRELTALGSPFAHVGITGYPESHPMIGDDLTVQAMWDKRQHATYVVSNLTFDPALLRTWVTRIRQRGIAAPLFVGLPGPVERTKLLAMATKIGVGESTRFLSKHRSTFARIAVPGGFSPERFLDKSAPTLADPRNLVRGLHLFTFNQVAETERWRRDLLARLGSGIVDAAG
ncbi:MAG: methylenetetrahydrofolate reductase [Nocardioidaceae bacterium]